MKCPNCERESNGRFCVNCGCVMPPVTNLEVSVGADDISTSNNGNTREAVASNVVKASFSGAETRYEVKGYEKKSRSSGLSHSDPAVLYGRSYRGRKTSDKRKEGSCRSGFERNRIGCGSIYSGCGSLNRVHVSLHVISTFRIIVLRLLTSNSSYILTFQTSSFS